MKTDNDLIIIWKFTYISAIPITSQQQRGGAICNLYIVRILLFYIYFSNLAQLGSGIRKTENVKIIKYQPKITTF